MWYSTLTEHYGMMRSRIIWSFYRFFIFLHNFTINHLHFICLQFIVSLKKLQNFFFLCHFSAHIYYSFLFYTIMYCKEKCKYLFSVQCHFIVFQIITLYYKIINLDSKWSPSVTLNWSMMRSTVIWTFFFSSYRLPNTHISILQ